MIEFHRSHQPALTIAAYPRTVTIDLGVLEIDDRSAIRGYAEKPSLRYECSMGVYLYSPRAIRAIGADERLDFPDLVLRLLERGEEVLAFRSDCYWLDIGRREDYERAQAEFPEMSHLLLPDPASTPRTIEPSVGHSRLGGRI
jgi:NDP-sugar pyrophosphorylase family protein